MPKTQRSPWPFSTPLKGDSAFVKDRAFNGSNTSVALAASLRVDKDNATYLSQGKLVAPTNAPVTAYCSPVPSRSNKSKE